MLPTLSRGTRCVRVPFVRFLRGERVSRTLGPIDGELISSEDFSEMQYAKSKLPAPKQKAVIVDPDRETKFALEGVSPQDLNEAYKPIDGLADYKSDPFYAQYLDTLRSTVRPTYNVAALADKSEVLQKLVQMNVPIHKFDKRLITTSKILSLDWEKDCVPKIFYLMKDMGVETESLTKLLTRRPQFLTLEMETIQERMTHLKEFCGGDLEIVSRTISKFPKWLFWQREYIEGKLQVLKETFGLTNAATDALIRTNPKVLNLDRQELEVRKFAFFEEFGFTNHQIRSMISKRPKILMVSPPIMNERFNILHNEFGFPHKAITAFPEVLLRRPNQYRHRHAFLCHLGRNQYDPTQPGYVDLLSLVELPDQTFAEDIAKTSVEEYDEFLKKR